MNTDKHSAAKPQRKNRKASRKEAQKAQERNPFDDLLRFCASCAFLRPIFQDSIPEKSPDTI
jgi:hypothetical protein